MDARAPNGPRLRLGLGLLLTASLALAPAPAVAATEEPARVSVVGGETATPGSAEWMAAVVTHSSAGGSDAQRQFCGGALLEPEVVLTAAHCVRDRAPDSIQVVLGRSDLSSHAGARHEVTAILAHPLFSARSYSNDVALLRLAEPSAQPTLPLVPAGERLLSAPWRPAAVLGWGSIVEGGPASRRLLSARISVLPDGECSRRSAYGSAFAKGRMLCAGTQAGGVGSCSGDSGGPLTAGDGAPSAIGIVSWARGCVRPGYPTVYTKLSDRSINSWVRAAATALAAGQTAKAPPRTVISRIGPAAPPSRAKARHARARGGKVRFSAPGEAWSAFQCSPSGGGRFFLCPRTAAVSSVRSRRACLRVRALDLFGIIDPSPALVRSSGRC